MEICSTPVLPPGKQGLSSLSPTHTQWLLGRYLQSTWVDRHLSLLLCCLVRFFWVWNKITKVESGFRKSEVPLKENIFDSCVFPALWQWQNADKIWEWDEMKQPIRVPCHLGRWWLKMASLTASRGAVWAATEGECAQGLGFRGCLRTGRVAGEPLWKQHSPRSH